MSTDQLESLLRKAPAPPAPASLLGTLTRGIDLPTGAAGTPRAQENVSWLRQWLPTIGFTVWFLGCVIVLGMQANRIADLQERARSGDVARQPAPEGGRNITAAKTGEQQAQHDRIAAEIAQLRAEVAQLRAALAVLPQLRADNAQLQDELLKARAAATAAKPEDDFFASQQERVTRIQCVNHLKQLCLAARLWANETKTDAMPRDTASLKPFLDGARGEAILYCPKDGTTPYQILSPGAPETRPHVVFVRCPLHNNVGLVDGSVQQLGSSNLLTERDGEWIIWTAKDK